MITREHLELAALAAGMRIAITKVNGQDEFVALDIASLPMWCPHLDDGDAARLAAAVGMKVIAPKHSGDGASAEPLDGRSRSVTVYRKDKAEQMRIAIVLCAAAVGERMKGGA